MVYLNYITCCDNAISRHNTALKALNILTLSAFGIETSEKLIVKSKSGRPHIKNSDFDFSISHTGTVALVAACGKGAKNKNMICFDEDISKIGVDIEREDRVINYKVMMKIVKEYLTMKEREYVSVGTEFDRERFLEIWTKKESIVKLTGEGFAKIKNADSFCKHLKFNKTIRLEIDGKKYIVSIVGM